MGRLWRFARGWVALCVILKKNKNFEKKYRDVTKGTLKGGCGVG